MLVVIYISIFGGKCYFLFLLGDGFMLHGSEIVLLAIGVGIHECKCSITHQHFGDGFFVAGHRFGTYTEDMLLVFDLR